MMYRDNKGTTPEQKIHECKICMSNESNAALIPCGHTGICMGCADNVILCPFCQAYVRDKLRIYHP